MSLSSSPEAVVTGHALQAGSNVWRVRDEPASTCVVSSSASTFTFASGGVESVEETTSMCMAGNRAEWRVLSSQEPVSAYRYVAGTPEPPSDVKPKLLLSQSSYYVSQLRPTRNQSAVVPSGSDVMFAAASLQTTTSPWHQDPRLPNTTAEARAEASGYIFLYKNISDGQLCQKYLYQKLLKFYKLIIFFEVTIKNVGGWFLET